MLKRGRGYRSPIDPELASSGAGGQMSDWSHKPMLLLHVCCGPCATAVIERIVSRFDVVSFWYNPNIEPPAEYERRLAGMRTVAEVMGVPLVEGERDTPSSKDTRFPLSRSLMIHFRESADSNRVHLMSLSFLIRKVDIMRIPTNSTACRNFAPQSRSQPSG